MHGSNPSFRTILSFVFHPVEGAGLSVYLWCTLRPHERERIARPSALHIGFEVLLPRAHPGIL
jgi:hypothetical protein